MKRRMRLCVRVALRLTMALAIAGASCLPFLAMRPESALAQETSRSINGHRVSGRFLAVWSSQGSDEASIYVNGLPITDRRAEISMTDGRTYDTQWFERARFEAHPENRAPYDVLLGLLGVTLTEGRPTIDPATHQPRDPADRPFMRIPEPADADGKTRVWYPETGHSVAGTILQYWHRYGGLSQFGFPLSEQFQEVSPTDGKTYTVQYFERNRFELHPEKRAPYEVELGLLGVQQYMTTPVPGDRLPVAPPKGVKSSKDTLVLGVGSEPAGLLPNGVGNSMVIFLQMLYNGSVNWDAQGNLWPGDLYYVPLVENGGAYYVGQGGDRHLVVKEKVRFGLHWSDGVPITSDDWVYSFSLGDSGTVDTRELYGVDAPDANTVIYNFMSYNQALAAYNKPGQDNDLMALLKPYIDAHLPVTDAFYTRMDDTAPLPAHVLKSISPDKLADSEYEHNPVVDGPFKVDHWDAGTQMVLVPNPYYSLTDPPLFKRVVVKFISDAGQLMAQLETGDLDAAPSVGGSGTPPTPAVSSSDLSKLATAGQTVINTPTLGWEHIDFNLDKAQFKDKMVRQAILTGIDRQAIIDKVLLGRGSRMNTYIAPALWASMDNPRFATAWRGTFAINTYSFDPVKANRMLDNAGWTKGPDGVRAKDGVRLEFDYTTTEGNAVRQQITQLVAADLSNLGIQANLKYVPASTLFGDLGPIAKRQFDTVEYGSTEYPDPSSWGFLYISEEIPTPDNNYNGQNDPGYHNARFDELEQASTLELNQQKRAPMFAEMQHIWNDDLPAMPLYSFENTSVYKSSLQNWFDTAYAGHTGPTYEVAAMYFK